MVGLVIIACIAPLFIKGSSGEPLMRDFMEIVRAVVSGDAGERVRHQGEVHRIRWRASSVSYTHLTLPTNREV